MLIAAEDIIFDVLFGACSLVLFVLFSTQLYAGFQPPAVNKAVDVASKGDHYIARAIASRMRIVAQQQQQHKQQQQHQLQTSGIGKPTTISVTTATVATRGGIGIGRAQITGIGGGGAGPPVVSTRRQRAIERELTAMGEGSGRRNPRSSQHGMNRHTYSGVGGGGGVLHQHNSMISRTARVSGSADPAGATRLSIPSPLAGSAPHNQQRMSPVNHPPSTHHQTSAFVFGTQAPNHSVASESSPPGGGQPQAVTAATVAPPNSYPNPQSSPPQSLPPQPLSPGDMHHRTSMQALKHALTSASVGGGGPTHGSLSLRTRASPKAGGTSSVSRSHLPPLVPAVITVSRVHGSMAMDMGSGSGSGAGLKESPPTSSPVQYHQPTTTATAVVYTPPAAPVPVAVPVVVAVTPDGGGPRGPPIPIVLSASQFHSASAHGMMDDSVLVSGPPAPPSVVPPPALADSGGSTPVGGGTTIASGSAGDDVPTQPPPAPIPLSPSKPDLLPPAIPPLPPLALLPNTSPLRLLLSPSSSTPHTTGGQPHTAHLPHSNTLSSTTTLTRTMSTGTGTGVTRSNTNTTTTTFSSAAGTVASTPMAGTGPVVTANTSVIGVSGCGPVGGSAGAGVGGSTRLSPLLPFHHTQSLPVQSTLIHQHHTNPTTTTTNLPATPFSHANTITAVTGTGTGGGTGSDGSTPQFIASPMVPGVNATVINTVRRPNLQAINTGGAVAAPGTSSTPPSAATASPAAAVILPRNPSGAAAPSGTVIHTQLMPVTSNAAGSGGAGIRGILLQTHQSGASAAPAVSTRSLLTTTKRRSNISMSGASTGRGGGLTGGGLSLLSTGSTNRLDMASSGGGSLSSRYYKRREDAINDTAHGKSLLSWSHRIGFTLAIIQLLVAIDPNSSFGVFPFALVLVLQTAIMTGMLVLVSVWIRFAALAIVQTIADAYHAHASATASQAAIGAAPLGPAPRAHLPDWMAVTLWAIPSLYCLLYIGLFVIPSCLTGRLLWQYMPSFAISSVALIAYLILLICIYWFMNRLVTPVLPPPSQPAGSVPLRPARKITPARKPASAIPVSGVAPVPAPGADGTAGAATTTGGTGTATGGGADTAGSVAILTTAPPVRTGGLTGLSDAGLMDHMMPVLGTSAQSSSSDPPAAAAVAAAATNANGTVPSTIKSTTTTLPLLPLPLVTGSSGPVVVITAPPPDVPIPVPAVVESPAVAADSTTPSGGGGSAGGGEYGPRGLAVPSSGVSVLSAPSAPPVAPTSSSVPLSPIPTHSVYRTALVDIPALLASYRSFKRLLLAVGVVIVLALIFTVFNAPTAIADQTASAQAAAYGGENQPTGDVPDPVHHPVWPAAGERIPPDIKLLLSVSILVSFILLYSTWRKPAVPPCCYTQSACCRRMCGCCVCCASTAVQPLGFIPFGSSYQGSSGAATTHRPGASSASPASPPPGVAASATSAGAQSAGSGGAAKAAPAKTLSTAVAALSSADAKFERENDHIRNALIAAGGAAGVAGGTQSGSDPSTGGSAGVGSAGVVSPKQPAMMIAAGTAPVMAAPVILITHPNNPARVNPKNMPDRTSHTATRNGRSYTTRNGPADALPRTDGIPI